MTNQSNQNARQVFKFILEILKTVAIMAIIAFTIKTYLIQTFVIDGLSMEPNFHNKEYILVDKISYRFSPPERGEIVVFKPYKTANPSRQTETDSYIKRIIGLPGETIKIYNGYVYINNRKLDEPYLASGTQTKISQKSLKSRVFTLKDNQYFVLGDNRSNSKDSRSIGAVNTSQIQGRVFIIFYPFSGFRMI